MLEIILLILKYFVLSMLFLFGSYWVIQGVDVSIDYPKKWWRLLGCGALVALNIAVFVALFKTWFPC